MRVLTVRQPWAWAIIHAGKDIENRSRNLAGGYRGPVAIHAGLTYEKDALAARARRDRRGTATPTDLTFGAVIGVVDLVDVHAPHESCGRWAQAGVWHLVLTDPRPLATPIPYRGALGLRTLPDDVAARVHAGIRST